MSTSKDPVTGLPTAGDSAPHGLDDARIIATEDTAVSSTTVPDMPPVGRVKGNGYWPHQHTIIPQLRDSMLIVEMSHISAEHNGFHRAKLS
jgi:hypothetical protein